MFQNRNVVAVVSSILHMTKDEDDSDSDDDMRDNQMDYQTFAYEVMRHLDIDTKMALQF